MIQTEERLRPRPVRNAAQEEEATSTEHHPVTVLGVGHELMGDDGIGPAVTRHLRASGVAANVQVIEAGTALLDALDLATPGADVLVVDAVSGGGAPGTVYRFLLEELEAHRGVTLHDPSLPEAFALARMAGASFGAVVVIGVEPETVAPGTELSPALAERLPAIADAVRCEIARLSGLTRAR